MTAFSKPLVLLLALVTALSFAAPASAQNDNNAGTVKIHQNEDEDPDQRNVPHVSCEFYVEGFNMNDPSGTLVFYSWPPTGDKTVVTPEGDDLSWESDGVNERGNHHFVKGPYSLPAGHYRLEVYTDDGHPGHNHFAKSKTFWVEPCESETVIPCPLNLGAEARNDGSIALSWNAVVDADGYNVYRAVEGGSFEMLATTQDTTYLDNETEVGTTYEYYVTAYIGNEESENCESIRVTSIPFFPSLLVGAVAMVGAVGAYAWMRRK